jgi:hypothetical protein
MGPGLGAAAKDLLKVWMHLKAWRICPQLPYSIKQEKGIEENSIKVDMKISLGWLSF